MIDQADLITRRPRRDGLWTQGRPRDDGAFDDVKRSAIGRRLRRLRLDAGMTQAQVAEELGYTNIESGRKSVSSYERGRHRMRLETLERFANAFGVTLEALVKNLPYD